jgi:hypothetical protein
MITFKISGQKEGIENFSKKKYCETAKRTSNEDANDSEDIKP